MRELAGPDLRLSNQWRLRVVGLLRKSMASDFLLFSVRVGCMLFTRLMSPVAATACPIISQLISFAPGGSHPPGDVARCLCWAKSNYVRYGNFSRECQTRVPYK